MREAPRFEPPAVARRADEQDINQMRHYNLITPLFGGGVTPGEADPVTVVRASEVRGHLRFWWRACCGGRFGKDLHAMKEAEDLLWGTSSTDKKPRPSQVQIALAASAGGETDRPYEVIQGAKGPQVKARRDSVVPPYAAFPLQPKQDEAKAGMPTKAVRVGVSFRLVLIYPRKHRADVEAALWAWETFGGIGARTRRGFGALCCTQVDGQPVPLLDTGAAEAAIREGLAKHVVDGDWPEGVPHLVRAATFSVKPGADALSAWRGLIDALKQFRQARNPGSDQNRPGRSKWPEPNAIRRITGQGAKKHATPPSGCDKFPRAVFGLPIIFHFKDDKMGDPRDTTLKGITSERLASPLILKPLACTNGRAVGLAVLLSAPRVPPGGLILEGVPHSHQVDARLTKQEAAQIQPLRGHTDVLKAFVESL